MTGDPSQEASLEGTVLGPAPTLARMEMETSFLLVLI